jgi:hypothetical protein
MGWSRGSDGPACILGARERARARARARTREREGGRGSRPGKQETDRHKERERNQTNPFPFHPPDRPTRFPPPSRNQSPPLAAWFYFFFFSGSRPQHPVGTKKRGRGSENARGEEVSVSVRVFFPAARYIHPGPSSPNRRSHLHLQPDLPLHLPTPRTRGPSGI